MRASSSRPGGKELRVLGKRLRDDDRVEMKLEVLE